MSLKTTELTMQLPEPADQRELNERSYFFAAALALFCSRCLAAYITYCENALKKINPEAKLGIVPEHFESCVKELLCFSIWLTLFEHPKVAPPWLMRFISCAHNYADRLVETPPSDEVTDRYRFADGIKACSEQLAFNVYNRLGMGVTAPDALVCLSELATTATAKRAELLQFALNEPLPVLDLTLDTEAAQRQ